MQITFFFRKPSPTFHSIEKLFNALIQNMPRESINLHYAKHTSKGLINRILIAIEARKKQSQINHITGDIHFISFFLKKKKTILTIHDIGIINSGNKLKRFIIKLFWFDIPIRRVEKITVISDFTRNELITRCHADPSKVIMIPNCYPAIYKFEGKKIRSGKPYILQIGTKPNKNLELLVEALQGIDCKLMIVSRLSDKQIQHLANNTIDYENYVNLPENEMFELYKKCDFLAYVSTYEGFGIPVIEANAVGRPVLASDIEPIKTVAGNAALLVNPFDSNQIRKGIQRLIDDNQLCDELINNGFKNAEKYHPMKIVKEYLSLYQSIISEK